MCQQGSHGAVRGQDADWGMGGESSCASTHCVSCQTFPAQSAGEKKPEGQEAVAEEGDQEEDNPGKESLR